MQARRLPSAQRIRPGVPRPDSGGGRVLRGAHAQGSHAQTKPAWSRQAYAGLLWSKQFYHYIVRDWLEGDPQQPPPPASRATGRNADWPHLYNRDVISMPDKWEYPWYAAWDLAFHMIPFARIDPDFAKQQLVLFLREWYMHPNGQLPAYEFNFGDVNPPVHAWACWRVYKMTAGRGQRDRVFLSRCFQKLLINFTWWVNRKDVEGRNLFAGGFLGLDNIGVFDRSKPLPTGGHLEQADGTAWMAFYCATMLSIALELARDNPATEDMASKFFEHFVAIADAMNTQGGTGLWDEEDGFYYDQLHVDGRTIPLKVRSLVGLIPLLAVEVLDDELIQGLPGFKKRMDWFLEHRPDLNRAHLLLLPPGQGQGPLPPAAGHPVAGAARARPALHARRERVPLALRHPLAFPRPPGPALHLPSRRPGTSGGLRARRVHHRLLRRQLQLARPGLVPAQLPADRGAGALPPLLRRQPARGMPHRLRASC